MTRYTRGTRTVALLEGAKGVLVLAAGLGALSLIHRDVQAYAEELVRTFHLNPASHYPSIFLDAAGRLNDAEITLLASAAAGYAAARFVEAYGLWKERRWAEWFAALAGAVYLPIEIVEIAHGLSWAKVTIFAINIAIVAYMSWVLWQSRQRTA